MSQQKFTIQFEQAVHIASLATLQASTKKKAHTTFNLTGEIQTDDEQLVHILTNREGNYFSLEIGDQWHNNSMQSRIHVSSDYLATSEPLRITVKETQ